MIKWIGKSSNKIFIFFLLTSLAKLNAGYAATISWDGGGIDDNWFTVENWVGDVAPGTGDIAQFDGTSSDNCEINGAVDVQGINITAAYSGIIAQRSGNTVTLGSSGFSQAGGTFVGDDAAITISNASGDFSLTGGAFTNSSAGLSLKDDFTWTGGTLTNTGKTISIAAGNATTFTCSGTVGGTVTIAKSAGGETFTLDAGCTINLGAGPSITMGANNLTNNGTIVIDSGTLTFTSSAGTVINNGTITHNGNGITCHMHFNNAVGATITYAGTAMSFSKNLTLSGTFDLTGKTLNIIAGGATTLTCSTTLAGTVTVTKSAGGETFTLSAGCTMNMGADPSISMGSNAFTNNGTIVIDSGTLTFTSSAGSVVNNGTITHNGNGFASNIHFTNSVGATVTYAGTVVSLFRNVTLSGTFDLTGKTLNLDTPVACCYTNDFTGSVSNANVVINPTGNTGSGVRLLNSLSTTGSLTLTKGTFNANNYDVTVGTFASSNTNVRTLTMGSGEWRLTGTGTVWDLGTITNLTFNSNTSTLKIVDSTAAAKTFTGAGQTYYNFLISGGANGQVTITGANTFNNFTIQGPPVTVTFPAATTNTINGTFTATGTAGNIVTINSSTGGSQATLAGPSSGLMCNNYLSVQDVRVQGGATWHAGLNSTNVSGNRGWQFYSCPTNADKGNFFPIVPGP